MKSRKLVTTSAAIFALALIAASCGKDKSPDTTVAAETSIAAETTVAPAETTVAPETTAAAGAETTAVAGASGTTGPQSYSVGVDAKNDTFPIAAVAYYPADLTVHPGDTVDFTSVFSGEPHTVTFGTLVDQGLPKAKPNDPEEPAELKKIPPLLPDGPGDAIQASAQPCFLATGDPPPVDACTADQHTQPEFDGTQTYYNSGFLADGDKFSVKFADAIAPGTYSFFCTLHRAGMTGKVTVVAADAKADTPDEVTTRGQDQLKQLITTLQPIDDALNKGLFPPFVAEAKPGSLLAGAGAENVSATISAFGPDPADIKVGETVTWTVVGPHTITFGGDESLRTFITKAPDGAVHVNPASFAPAGGAGQPAPPPEPSTTVGAAPATEAAAPPTTTGGPPPAPIDIDGGSYDGTGLKNSGIVLSFPPQLFNYKVTFTKAGSYPYVCLIHPDMKGTINVA